MRKDLKQLFALCTLLLATTSACFAGDEASLIVNKLNGEEYSKALSTVGRLYFTDGNIVLQTTDGDSIPICAISDARSIVFAKGNTDDRKPTVIPEVIRDKVSIAVYPNPSSGMVSVSGLPGGSEVRIFDLQGRPVLTSAAPSVDLSPLKAGIYLLLAGPEVVQIVRK